MRRLDVETLQRWREQGAVDPNVRLAMFSAEWQSLIDLAINGLRVVAPEARAIRWMVAIQTDRGYLIDGHPYVSRESAQQDVNLITARGEKAEVWECYRSQPQRDEQAK